MSQEVRNAALKEKTQQLLQGPLKHIRGAALAAALLPLASVAASPAVAQTACPSGGTCIGGLVWNDANNNGIQDAGESPIEGAMVFLFDGTETIPTETGPDGLYFFFPMPGSFTIYVDIASIGPGAQPSPTTGGNETTDSDGVSDGLGHSGVMNVTFTGQVSQFDVDFGFFTPPVQQPGTGTPGYWKNHPDAWPVTSITVGGMPYTREQAISWLGKVGKDKTTTMFSSLVSAMLNVLVEVNGVHNDSTCIASTIAAADAWMAAHHVGNPPVPASSDAWALGEPLHKQMDAYNNGQLCAPHRN
jgi:hypothetical protein